MSKRFWAKLAGWIGALATAVGQTGIAGKWSPVISIGGAALGAAGIHVASNTSAGHPNGDNTNK